MDSSVVGDGRKPYYSVQDRETNCGPVAIYNAMVFLGINPNIYAIEGLSECDPLFGAFKAQTTRALKRLRFNRDGQTQRVQFSQKRFPHMKDLEKALDKGYGIIYLYYARKDTGHYIFITRHTPKYLEVVNDIFQGKGHYTKRKRAKKYYSKKSRVKEYYPHAWIIKGLVEVEE